jgi:ELP3 family radical SAM enzyme/protein acetyltransferase
MACSTTNTKSVNNSGSSIDLEDLFLTKNDETTKQITSIRENFDTYKSMVVQIYNWVHDYQRNPELDQSKIKREFNKFFNNLVRYYRVYCKKNILVYAYRQMIENNEIPNDPYVWTFLQKRPARNMSGVTVITVLTSPRPDGQEFSCKHNCYYCPNEPAHEGNNWTPQPRSYLSKEPAVARANRNDFDPIKQMNDRLHGLLMNGHEIDKLEIIIEGGTYTEYPVDYLRRFHRDLVYCANTYFDDPKQRREPLSITEEIAINATSKVRIVGLSIETRPDALIDDYGESWLRRFREWGVTRVQLGVQHTNNTILKKINRGHTVEDASRAIELLKDNGIKVHIHLMPDLPFANPEEDIKMFDTVFKTPLLQPDEIKIYPCEVTPWTVIQKWHESGKYKPYAQTNERALLDVVKYGMELCPPWIRLPRVIRDIPLTYIQGGNMYPNLRQMLMDELEQEGKTTMDIRARECGRNAHYNIEDSIFMVRSYRTTRGTEYFISCESRDERCIFGFTRLRIPDSYDHTEFDCLHNRGFIRELHVYGNVTPVGFNKTMDSQHKGIGKQLMRIAEEISYAKNLCGTAVISGMGVTKYYEKLGYEMCDTYMIKTFKWYDFVSEETLFDSCTAIIVMTIICIAIIVTFT